jgi:cell wall-associated NlpC family hydrolase
MRIVIARGWLALSLICGMLSACSTAVYRSERAPDDIVFVTVPAPVAPSPERSKEVLLRALGLVGTRYAYGGDHPDEGFDCSGFVGYVYRDAAGVDLPRSSADIGAIEAPAIAVSDLVGGDIVMFAARGRVSHVGIYVGERRFVHAPKHGAVVRIDGLDAPWWREHYVGAKRLL